MGFVKFMNSGAGRLLRMAAGIALIIIGVSDVAGAAGWAIAAVGLVPLLAGIGNVCLFGPLLGVDMHGNPKSGHGAQS